MSTLSRFDCDEMYKDNDTSVQPQSERDKTVAGNGDGPSVWGELKCYVWLAGRSLNV